MIVPSRLPFALAGIVIAGGLLSGCIQLPKLGRGTTENVQRLDRALGQDPSNVHANFLRGRSEMQKGEPEEAIEFFQMATLVKPDFEEAWLGIGTAQMDMKDYVDAEETFRSAMAKFPASAAAREGAAAALLAQDRPLDAAKLAVEALALDPASGQAHRLLGESAYQRSDYVGALRHWREAMKLDSSLAAELRPIVEDLSAFQAKYGS